MATESNHVIEVVRGRLEPAVADQLVGFWSDQGALSEAAARQRLAEVVCVLRDDDGARAPTPPSPIASTSSAAAASGSTGPWSIQMPATPDRR